MLLKLQKGQHWKWYSVFYEHVPSVQTTYNVGHFVQYFWNYENYWLDYSHITQVCVIMSSINWFERKLIIIREKSSTNITSEFSNSWSKHVLLKKKMVSILKSIYKESLIAITKNGLHEKTN